MVGILRGALFEVNGLFPYSHQPSHLFTFTDIALITIPLLRMDDSKGMDMAFEEAKQSYSEGGIPVRKTGAERLYWRLPPTQRRKAALSQA